MRYDQNCNESWTLVGILGWIQACAAETHPFYLERQDGTIIEGYFSPPSTHNAPIIFAIQGSSCESALTWHGELSDQASALGLGVIVLEKQGIFSNNIDLLSYNQNNCLKQRLEDHLLCIESIHSIYPEWEGKPIFWGVAEGGILAANLASKNPETVAVLLFGVGGGMTHREEVKWALWHRLEQQGTMQEDKGTYMTFLDEQMDMMILHPSAENEFFGKTYKWWASLLITDGVASSLSQSSIPIYLVHGTEDLQIPIESADLAAKMLEETNALTYLRLQNRGHNIATTDIQNAASCWLSTILFRKEPLDDSLIAQINVSRRLSSNTTQMTPSAVLFCKSSKSGDGGHGDVYGSARTDIDTDGNEKASLDGGVKHDFGNGWDVDIRGGVSGSKDKDGNFKGEAHAEARVNGRY